MLSLEIDPKLAWALAHRERFPVDLNRAPTRDAAARAGARRRRRSTRLLQARRVRRLRIADLERLRVPLAKVLPFVELADATGSAATRRSTAGRPAPRSATRRSAQARCSTWPTTSLDRRAKLPHGRRQRPSLSAGAGRMPQPRCARSRSPARSISPASGAPAAQLWSAQVAPDRVVLAQRRRCRARPVRRRSAAAPASPPPARRRRLRGRAPAHSCRSARASILHRDPERFGLLYRLLWRSRSSPACAHDPLDPDWLRADQMAQAVRRDMHKMKAFVRFRTLADDGDGAARRCTSPGSSPSTTSSRRPRRSSRAASRPCAGRS